MQSLLRKNASASWQVSLPSLAIFISCLGLLGLASYVAERRTKEIGIRKVLGASVSQLWQLLSKDFVVLVVLSSLIAIPIAYYFLHGWLQNYEYRTALSLVGLWGGRYGGTTYYPVDGQLPIHQSRPRQSGR